jgi:predicted O-methyltransferase YrrM
MWPDTRQRALAVKGFMPEAEGLRLYELAYAASANGPCVEIGSYCGKSAIYLGDGCRTRGQHRLFSIDHHCGSEEQQPGQEYFDPELFDETLGRVNTLSHFVRNLRDAGLEDWVIPIVGRSSSVAASWPEESAALVFIDGGHAKSTVESDYHAWSDRILRGGWLLFHDVYPDPAGGGQAPREVYEAALASGRWTDEGLFGSLGMARRK